MSDHERQDAEVINMVNGTMPKAEERKKEAEREEARYNMVCWSRGFCKILVDAGGYIGLGSVVLAAMASGIVPWYAAVPVFTACWIWSALRIDRCFRW